MPARVLRWMRCSTGRARHLTPTAGLACALVLWHHNKAHGHALLSPKPQHRGTSAHTPQRLPAWAVSIISGAVGECGGQVLLYPVETIKVLSQQSGESATRTLRSLLHRYSHLGTLRILFRGAAANIPITMVTGASYLGIFQISTRAITRLMPPDPAATARHFPPEQGTSSAHGDPRAAVLAAVFASLAVALISGPLDMARNRKQAGLVAEPLLQYTFSPRGLRETLPFIGPFMLCSVPHDLTELLVYFQLRNTAERLPDGSLRARHQEAVDAALGAAAGAAGVLLSTPADCIKTKLITRGAQAGHGAHAREPLGGRSWLGMAAATVRRQGASGLFVGVVPRLLDEVPGSMLHWVIAERCTRWMQAM
eukprot:jgi/Ulvmu1/7054/UM033_0114.1